MSAVRGGSAWFSAGVCRSSYRSAFGPWNQFEDGGFRTKHQPTIVTRGSSCMSKTERCRVPIRFVEGLYDNGWNRGFRTKAY